MLPSMMRADGRGVDKELGCSYRREVSGGGEKEREREKRREKREEKKTSRSSTLCAIETGRPRDASILSIGSSGYSSTACNSRVFLCDEEKCAFEVVSFLSLPMDPSEGNPETLVGRSLE